MESKDQVISGEEKVAVDRSAADILDPSVNVAEADERQIKAPIVSETELSDEEKAEEVRSKQEHYQKEEDERNGVTRSAIDKGQESQLSPSAEKALRQSQAEKTQKPEDKKSVMDKVLHR